MKIALLRLGPVRPLSVDAPSSRGANVTVVRLHRASEDRLISSKASFFEDGRRADPLEGKIDGSLAGWTRPVQGACWYGDELAGPDDQLAILELDDQFAI